ncbi:MAG: hypothetical protein IPK83_09025 [Planctomycetes bacterium]|nr:hypothetical protein [Planctomycetota bacterium]
MASTLGPLAESGVNLDLVMGYANPDKTVVSIEVFPIANARAQKAARAAGLSKAEFPCVVVSGKNKAGIGRQISASLADAGINVNFFVAQAHGKEYVGLFSFEAQSEADLAMKVLKNSLNGRNGNGKKKTKTRRTA